jgi:uncharacterized protein (TIGR03437 family)
MAWGRVRPWFAGLAVLATFPGLLEASPQPGVGVYWVALRLQPQEEIVRRTEEAARLQLELYESRYQSVAERAWFWPQAVEASYREWVEVQREVRRAAFEEIERVLRPEQEAVARLVESVGGRVLRRYSSISLLLVELPEGAAERVGQDDRVAGVWPDPGAMVLEEVRAEKPAEWMREASDQRWETIPRDPPGLSMGAGPLWDRGINGAGEWIALLCGGVDPRHPILRGVRMEGRSFLTWAKTWFTGFADQEDAFVEQSYPGSSFLGCTRPASVIAARGMEGGWENYRGVAWGVSGLMILKVIARFQSGTGYVGGLTVADSVDAWEWLVRNRPEVKLAVDKPRWVLEYYATTYDIFGAVQSEVSESQISQPTRQGELDRYASVPSLVAVAEVDVRGTRDRADDVLDRSSPRGPTTDGQRKPDLAVPAVGFWVAKPGSTELEALAQGEAEARSALAGAAALLRQAGVRRALELKALLINSTTRTQWSPEWGWGAVDVERAYAQRQGVVSGAVAPGSQAYYRGSVEGAFSTTLAWNRQVQMGEALARATPWPGCLANLDLRVYRESNGALLGASTSTVDAVERVLGNASGSVLVKVTHAGNACRNPEPFALAISQGTLVRLSGASLGVACAAPPQVVAGQPFTLTCTVRNAGDVGAVRVNGSLQLGAQSGVAQMGFGDVGAGGVSVRSVTVNAPGGAGTVTWRLEVNGTVLDDAVTVAASGNLNVVAAGSATGPVLALTPAQISLQARATDAPVSRTIRVANSGAGAMSWTATTNQAWLEVRPASGSGAGEVTVTVQPGLLALPLNVGQVTFAVAGLPSQVVTVIVELIGPPAPVPVITQVVNGATFTEGFAPGSWVTIRGQRLAPTTRIWRAEEIVEGRLPVELDGVRVNIGGRPAAVYYISPEQLNVQAPDEEGEGPVPVEVITPQGRAVATAERRSVAPGVFVYQAGGKTLVAALHANTAVLVAPVGLIPGYETRPARPGDVIQLYATGLGLNTNPRVASGRVPEGPAELLDVVNVWVGGQPARVLWKGLVSPGLYQINLEVPAAPEGDQAVEIQVRNSPRVRSQGVLPVGR